MHLIVKQLINFSQHCVSVYTVPSKKTNVKVSCYDGYFTFGYFKNYSHISIKCGTAMAMIAEQCALTIYFTWRVYTHYLVMLPETK